MSHWLQICTIRACVVELCLLKGVGASKSNSYSNTALICHQWAPDGLVCIYKRLEFCIYAVYRDIFPDERMFQQNRTLSVYNMFSVPGVDYFTGRCRRIISIMYESSNVPLDCVYAYSEEPMNRVSLLAVKDARNSDVGVRCLLLCHCSAGFPSQAFGARTTSRDMECL